ncbi:hypothetical protein BC628DRAFT_1004413 [Trametes gibbosa]|nr:hypothetical protein BC628DRAFT_1004413 [Trametes gibbosa]
MPKRSKNLEKSIISPSFMEILMGGFSRWCLVAGDLSDIQLAPARRMRGERNQGECITLMLLPRPTGTIRIYSGRAPRASPGSHSGGPVIHLTLRHDATRCLGPPLALSLHIRSSIWDKARALGASLEKRTHAMESAHEPARAKDAYHITYQALSLLPLNTTIFPLTFRMRARASTGPEDGRLLWPQGRTADSSRWSKIPGDGCRPLRGPRDQYPPSLPHGGEVNCTRPSWTDDECVSHIIPSTLSGVGSL